MFDFPDAPVNGEIYSANGVTYQWNGFAWATGPVTSGSGMVPIAGGVMTGPLILSEDPVDVLGAATKQYVDAGGSSGGIPDAPSDGQTYGRKDAAWVPITLATIPPVTAGDVGEAVVVDTSLNYVVGAPIDGGDWS